MDLTKTMETLNASAETANDAAETALLASEGVIALSTKVSDEVRSAVQEAIKSAGTGTAPKPSKTPGPEFIEEEPAPNPLIEQAPLIVSVLTLCGVGYLAMQNGTLTEELELQYDKMVALEEQLQSNVGQSGSQIMMLAEQGQRMEESLLTLAEKKPEATEASPSPEHTSQLASLNKINTQIENIQQNLTQLHQLNEKSLAAKTEPTATAETTDQADPVTTIAVTLDGIRTTLQQELTPLQLSIKSVEEQLKKEPIPLQPIKMDKRKDTVEQKQKPMSFSNDKPRVYRFP